MQVNTLSNHRGQPQTAVYLQEACLRHQFIRSKDTSNIVERPERLRAVNIGLAAAISRLEIVSKPPIEDKRETDPDELAAALDKLKIAQVPDAEKNTHPFKILKSSASVNILDNLAVKFVHGDIEGDVYLENLVKWTKASRDTIAEGGSEIPEGLSQGDLYLCPGSIDAIQGALGTVCEAVDAVIESSRNLQASLRAFVAVRPPGHHCGEDSPSGFCFVNNVAVGAAHAHLKHNINRVVIFDIDLHHGNGTQSIVWQINEETYRSKIEESSGSTSAKPGPQIYYGSIHDVLSYPCEDGKPELVQAASVSIHGPHGQYIENIHLQTYNSELQFFEELYEKRYKKLLSKAEEFLEQTGGAGDDVLVFISAGFDACEHEYQSMQRHNRRVPTTFYYRFTQDVCKFAERYAKGKLISVLEGGYSDRALMSGAMAHVAGLVTGADNGDGDKVEVDPRWWSLTNIEALEQATKKRRGGRPSQTNTPPEPWIQRTQEILATIDTHPPPSRPVIPPSTMSLRDRNHKSASGRVKSPEPETNSNKNSMGRGQKNGKVKDTTQETQLATSASGIDVSVVSTEISESQSTTFASASKKVPRVILRLPPDPSRSS